MCTPPRCCSTSTALKEAIPKCDEPSQELSTGWTRLFGNSSGYISPFVKRYCSLNDPVTEETECIFEEFIVSLNN